MTSSEPRKATSDGPAPPPTSSPPPSVTPNGTPKACTIQTRKPSPAPAGEPEREFNLLKRLLTERSGWNNDRLAREVLRQEALLLATDKSPVDVIWRRTLALIKHMKTMDCAPDTTADEAALEALRSSVSSSASASADAQLSLFVKIAAIRRSVALRNPLLDFDKILFVTHRLPSGERHMCSQYHGHNARAGGSLYVVENAFSTASPKVTDLLAGVKVESGRLAGRSLPGAMLSPDLSFDGRTILFSNSECGSGASWSTQRCYHVYSMGVDGTHLRQLTDGAHDDFHPFWLPSGRVGFISTRIGGFGRCHSAPKPTYTIHSMKDDGSDLTPVSYHETNEWHPSVANDGSIVYTRWDYVDRDSDVAHSFWTTYPDGRDPRTTHGNYPDKREMRPWMEMSIRAIPDSKLFVGVAAPHHGLAFGSIIIIDPSIKDDRAMSQVKRVTPEVMLPESERAPGVPYGQGAEDPRGEIYGTPWPLSVDFYLAVYDPDRRNYGIYLVDSFGNKEFIYQDKAIHSLDPIPLRARPSPPVIASPLPQGPDAVGKPSTVAIADVYQSEFPLPTGVKVKEVRVVNLFPKETVNDDQPKIGGPRQSLARGVLGTAPVEDDGSAFFEMPAGVSVYFQLLDEKGVVVHTMRSATYTHPGEAMSCIGCHEPKGMVAPTNQPRALLRQPSKLKPEPTGSYPLSFPRLVQPVLDAKCVECHESRKAPGLGKGDSGRNGWSVGFSTLVSRCVGRSGGNGTAMSEKQYSIPGKEGSKASRLYATLSKDHYGLQLTTEEMRRITLWLDTNCNFYGAYSDTAKQASGQIVMPKLGLPLGVPTASLVR